MENIFFDNWQSIVRTLVIGILAYLSLIAMLRISGKRTLSQMKEFDFIITVALGSTLSSVLLNKDVVLLDGITALALLIVLQYILAVLGMRSNKFSTLISSEPTLVFFRGKFLHEALKKERITESEVRSILRDQQISSLSEVGAVVLESNGQLSVVKTTSLSDQDSTLYNGSFTRNELSLALKSAFLISLNYFLMTQDISTVLKWAALLIAVPVALYLGKTFLAPLAIGIVLAMMLTPVMDWLIKKGFNQGWAIFGSTTLLLLFFAILGSLIALQVKMLVTDWPKIEEDLIKLLDDAQAFIKRRIGIGPDKQVEQAKKLLSNIGKGGASALGTISGALTGFFLVTVYIVLFLSQRDRFRDFVLLNVPISQHDRTRKLLTEIRKTPVGYFWGMFKAMMILAALYATGFLIGGVKYSLLLAAIAAICTFIPYLGNVVGGSLAAILAMVSGGVQSVMIVFGVMFSAQIIDNYVTQPYVVGKEIDLNPFMTIVSVIAFGVLWGIPGAIIAIPVTGMLRVCFKYLDGYQSLVFLMGNDRPAEKEGDGR